MNEHQLAEELQAQVIEFTPPLPCCAVITYDEEILCRQPATVGLATHEAGLVGEGEHWRIYPMCEEHVKKAMQRYEIA